MHHTLLAVGGGRVTFVMFGKKELFVVIGKGETIADPGSGGKPHTCQNKNKSKVAPITWKGVVR